MQPHATSPYSSSIATISTASVATSCVEELAQSLWQQLALKTLLTRPCGGNAAGSEHYSITRIPALIKAIGSRRTNQPNQISGACSQQLRSCCEHALQLQDADTNQHAVYARSSCKMQIPTRMWCVCCLGARYRYQSEGACAAALQTNQHAVYMLPKCTLIKPLAMLQKAAGVNHDSQRCGLQAGLHSHAASLAMLACVGKVYYAGCLLATVQDT